MKPAEQFLFVRVLPCNGINLSRICYSVGLPDCFEGRKALYFEGFGMLCCALSHFLPQDDLFENVQKDVCLIFQYI